MDNSILLPLVGIVGALLGFILGRLTAKPANQLTPDHDGTVVTPKISPGGGGTPR